MRQPRPVKRKPRTPNISGVPKFEVDPGIQSDFLFGVRGAKRFAYSLALEALEGIPSKFVDAFAGSNVVAREMRCELGVQLVTNDVNYYSVAIARSFIGPDDPDISLDLDEVEPIEGEGWASGLDKYFEPEVLQWMDGFAVHFKDHPAYISALGSALHKATFRAIGFEKKFGHKLTIEQIKKFVDNFFRRKLKLITPGPAPIVHWGLAEDLLLNIEPGGVLYIDPAWPGVSAPAGYIKFARQLNAILGQSMDYPDITAWSKHDVVDKICYLLEMGAKKFSMILLATQSTNYPEVSDLIEQLIPDFEVDAVFTQWVKSRASRNIITENLIRIRGEGPE